MSRARHPMEICLEFAIVRHVNVCEIKLPFSNADPHNKLNFTHDVIYM